ncbi:thiamine diphosphokinase [Bacteroides sp. 519]|uniref:thiamine diphosphokinase n=1 Tax=Bacteroides sp. 519 TaxID=2302937 RepID=UPI0013D106D6|nr:thiamine diphosphokinase [Bacteroides sp. 519]NDV58878.1 thiamine diphosphokinase [Bacteroides sp. 519]
MNYYPLLNPTSLPDAVILANGEFPTHPLPLYFLHNSPFVVCCDGAANQFIAQGYTPNAIVGDGDSISPENRKKFADILFINNDQETNDQTKAVNYCVSQGKKHIIIVGATGKREDHTLGNISLLMDYMEYANVEMVTDYGVFTPVKDSGNFECMPSEQISIINFGATGVRGENLVYPLSDFTNWWQGTLNECTGNNFIIHATGRYLVFRGSELFSVFELNQRANKAIENCKAGKGTPHEQIQRKVL